MRQRINFAIFMAVLCLSAFASAENDRARFNSDYGSLEGRAEAFVSTLAAGRPTQVMGQMTPALRATMSDALLRQMFAKLYSNGGELKRVGQSIATERQDGQVEALVPLYYARGNYVVQIDFARATPLSPISALTILPYDERAKAMFESPVVDEFGRLVALPPSYANDDLFREDFYQLQIGDGDSLAAMLAMPTIASELVTVPAVLLVSGVAPTDEHMKLGSTLPYRDIAQGLSSRGIAVLRIANRFNQDRESIKSGETTFDRFLVRDTLAALRVLKQNELVNEDRITIVGHGLGAHAALVAHRIFETEKVVLLNPYGENPEEDAAAEIAEWKLPSESNAGVQFPASFWKSVRQEQALQALSNGSSKAFILLSEDSIDTVKREYWEGLANNQFGITLRTYSKLNRYLIPPADPTMTPFQVRDNVSEDVINDLVLFVTRGRLGY